jgi:hypothetical protein
VFVGLDVFVGRAVRVGSGDGVCAVGLTATVVGLITTVVAVATLVWTVVGLAVPDALDVSLAIALAVFVA